MSDAFKFKSGFVAVIGVPNVGKSTLVNAIVGEKVSIVTERPQTTRRKILGIKNVPEGQIILVDTPGVHTSQKIFNKLMIKSAFTAIADSDIIIHMIDVEEKKFKEANNDIKFQLKKTQAPAILVVNKIDKIKKNLMLPIIDDYSKEALYKEIIPVSALFNDGVDGLINVLLKYLPVGERLFPDDMITDQAERFMVSEMVREKLFQFTRQEIPYSLDVVVEEFDESDKNLLRISADIIVEKDSQKAIVIGKGGSMLKNVGESARRDMEKLLNCKVFLKLWVKVRQNWSRDRGMLKTLGYL
ncbi:MAG TPA: GTPase Era [bacterium]